MELAEFVGGPYDGRRMDVAAGLLRLLLRTPSGELVEYRRGRMRRRIWRYYWVRRTPT